MTQNAKWTAHVTYKLDCGRRDLSYSFNNRGSSAISSRPGKSGAAPSKSKFLLFEDDASGAAR